MKRGSIVCCTILRLLTLAVSSSSLDLRHLMWSSMINTAVILPCCFLLSLLFAGFVVECGATVTRRCRRRLRHISPDQGPRFMCECKLKLFPWGRAVLITKFEEDSSDNCVLKTVCPNAPNIRMTIPTLFLFGDQTHPIADSYWMCGDYVFVECVTQ